MPVVPDHANAGKQATPEQCLYWNGRRRNVKLALAVGVPLCAVALWEIGTLFGRTALATALVLIWVFMLFAPLLVLPPYLRCPACLSTWSRHDPADHCKECGIRFDA